MIDPKKPIRRSRHDGVLGGVCAGLAAWADWHPSVVRVLYVVVTVFTGFVLGIAAYLVLWVFLPVEAAAVGGAARRGAPDPVASAPS
jgi:phage shock protein PspC (stress-responsive transcriptional regulator)